MTVLFTFPGQGSQNFNMIEQLPDDNNLRQEFHSSLRSLNIDLDALIQSQSGLINQTSVTQPAILAHSYLTFKSLEKSLSQHSVLLAGHSLGELSAACLSFNLSLQESLELAQKRAQLMIEAMDGHGIQTQTLALIGLYDESVVELLEGFDQLWPINFNGPSQTVITGCQRQAQQFIEKAQHLKQIKKIIPIALSVSSHCPLLQNSVSKWKKILDSVIGKRDLRYPIASNRTAKLHTKAGEVIDNLAFQLCEPVYYHAMMSHLIETSPSLEAIVECGPGQVLSGLHRRLRCDATLFDCNTIGQLESYLTRSHTNFTHSH